jgi:hypothetical protein
MKHWTREAIDSIHSFYEEEESVEMRLSKAFKIKPARLEPSLVDKVKLLSMDEAVLKFLQDNPPTGNPTLSSHPQES